jgi:hypothetical protein
MDNEQFCITKELWDNHTKSIHAILDLLQGEAKPGAQPGLLERIRILEAFRGGALKVLWTISGTITAGIIGIVIKLMVTHG